MIWLAIAAAALAGYGIGRIQPHDRLAEWANWQLRFHLDRWNASRPRQAFLFTLLLATDPAGTVRAWRHRNDPPPPRSPAVRIRGIDAEAP